MSPTIYALVYLYIIFNGHPLPKPFVGWQRVEQFHDMATCIKFTESAKFKKETMEVASNIAKNVVHRELQVIAGCSDKPVTSDDSTKKKNDQEESL